MTIKRIILIVLTVFAVLKVLLSLGASFSEPQVQSRVELYQTQLLLHAAELSPSELFDLSEEDDIAENGQNLLSSFLGEDPYLNAQNQYENAREVAQTTRSTLQTQLQQFSSALSREEQEEKARFSPTSSVQVEAISQQQEKLQEEIQNLDQFMDEVDLELGILQAHRGKIEDALNTWTVLVEEKNKRQPEAKIVQTAKVLQGLWAETPRLLPNAESYLHKNLEGWFQYRSLKQLYQLQQRQDALLNLQEQEKRFAQQALGKLAVISGIPLLGGILGVGILLFLLIQWVFIRERSLLGNGGALTWDTPWDGEITWQVIIVGFFCVGQILLPILFALSGFNPTGLSLRGTATYILISYILMALGGLLVLYFSLKPFFPLPEDWFRFKIASRWMLWGIGGYWVSLPVVVLVSLINQQIWNGNGGSNPIIFLALQAQDTVALGIFFFTASVAAPVFEEIMFRGFLLPSLTRYFPAWGAVLLSSLLFSVAHLSLSEVLPLTALGIVLGFVYLRSRNLLSSILLHSLWNSGTLLSLFVLGSGVS